jgi:hypothetical protein
MTSRRSEPLIPRFKISFELEPRAFDHAEARRAAQRAADAIEEGARRGGGVGEAGAERGRNPLDTVLGVAGRGAAWLAR